MERQKIELIEEKSIITNMITSTQFLKELYPVTKREYFESSYARMIFKWISDYWRAFKEAPGKNIQDIYLQKSKTIRGEDENELISDFLHNLSKQYEDKKPTNINYTIKKAVHWMKVQSLKVLKEKIESSVKLNDPLLGEQYIANYSRVERAQGNSVDIVKDENKIISAFLMEEEKLFRFPGVLGQVTGDFLRGDLVAFMAASGRGKTWWQLYLAITAMTLGYNVVFFNLEMTEAQIVRRAWQSLEGSPKTDREINVPYFDSIESKEGMYRVKHRKEIRKSVDTTIIKKRQKQYKFQFKGGKIKLISFPSDTVTVDDLEACLDNLEYYEGFIPDVVGVDYADLLKNDKTKRRNEYRHDINTNWIGLRRMGLARNVLMVSATQTDRSAYSKDAGEQNIAEDIRKLTHVGKMIAINQTKKEYKAGIARVSSLKERDEKKYVQEAVVLQCLDIGRPCIDSKFRKNVVLPEKNKD